MNVYYIKGFPGHYPVGTSAVIVAQDRIHAFNLLHNKLKEKYSLTLDYRDIGQHEFIQLDVNSAHAVVLQDGDY